uniref:Uncharacterized protein n=1 Tax=Rhizophora mucronata TaxID=61149 RepID=A0A2P2NL79_RHIMU
MMVDNLQMVIIDHSKRQTIYRHKLNNKPTCVMYSLVIS